MNFFDRHRPPPPPEEPHGAHQQPPWSKPETVLGGTAAVEAVLARGHDAAVGLGSLRAYPNGFSFTVTAVLDRDDRRGRFHQAFHHDALDGEPPPPEFLRVGVQFADGSAATNLGGWPHDTGPAPAGPLLLHDSGGGGGRRYDMGFWVWPLPPPGPVTFVCEWPAHGIAESRVEVDARVIREAAARAITLR